MWHRIGIAGGCVLWCFLFQFHGLRAEELPTELFLRGYSVVPTPRKVVLGSGEVWLDGDWGWRAPGLPPEEISITTLARDLEVLHGLELGPSRTERKSILLAVQPGRVQSGAEPGIDRQAYRLEVRPDAIEIVGNDRPGLFYGVQTLLQLIRTTEDGRRILPQVQIEDWPSFELRFLHWDTKHHQDRLETLKRYLDWAARFKINRIGFELEDKFEYPSHPVIGAPGAFTTEQLQELVDYGLERHIQIIPNIQSPAHMAYVLKHPQFAHLRADGNNYQACLCDEESYQLIFSMYEDVIRATRGVEAFFVSTDEVYYAGICARCDRPYNPENRSLRWVEFVQRAHRFLKERGRRMLAWVEYPLLPRHISLLPPDLIDGVLGNDPRFIEEENKRGIRQLVYTSMQGSEYLFPNYWSAQSGDFRSRQGRLRSAFRTLSVDAWKGNPIGVFGAAWDDSGLHNETFWLGWATVAQYGWTHGTPSVEQHVAEFMNVYYGPRVTGMVEIYQGLQRQARFFQSSWDRVVSRVRGPGYGNSRGPGHGTVRRDDTLPPPALPRLPGLDFAPVYVGRYGQLVEQARRQAEEAQELLHRIYENIPRATRNRYNLEVLLSLAHFTRHHNQMLLSLKNLEDRLAAARQAAEAGQQRSAVENLVAAYREAEQVVQDRQETLHYLTAVWEKSRYPKGQAVGGRTFSHVLDDTKDHWADRRPDLSYLTAPEESIGLEQWMEQLARVLREYAGRNGVPLDQVQLELEPEE